MPFQIPAYSQFQWQVPAPLKGNWNRAPAEGDRILNAEIDWLAGGQSASAYQFQVGGNSPVALSQIVAIYCDNRRCGSDITFWFPDTGFELVIPAHTQGLFPVFTNALMFYAIGQNVATGDVTILQVCNSMPPPIALLPATQAAVNGTAALTLTNSQTLQIIPLGVSGTVTGISINGQLVGDAAGNSAAVLNLQDGEATPKIIFSQDWNAPANGLVPVSINMSGLALRFINGLQMVTAIVVGQGFLSTGAIAINVTYTTP